VLVAGVIYAVTFAAVLLSRWRFDGRRRTVERLGKIVTGPEGQRLDRRARQAWVSNYLAAIPQRRLVRITAEMALPSDVNDALCRHLLDRVAIDEVRRNASTGGRHSRWARIAALRLLAFGRPDEAWRALERALVARDQDVAGAAVTILGNMTDIRAAELLVKTLRVGRYPGSRVATFLDQFPLDLSAQLRPLVHYPGHMLRYWGARLLQRYPALPGLDKDLSALIRDEEPLVRRAALESLAVVGGPTAVAAARACLADEVWFVRAHAARALGVLGDAQAAPLVAPLLADKEWWVRYAAKVGLEAMGPAVADDLLPLLTHPDGFARNGAAEVLQNLGTFEWLLNKEAQAAGVNGHHGQLEALARAGGLQMSEAALDRLAPETRGRAAQVLESLGVERVGTVEAAR